MHAPLHRTPAPRLTGSYAPARRPAPVPAPLRRLLAAEPFAGRVKLTCAQWPSGPLATHAVAIPVRKEIALLPRALAGLEAAFAAAPEPGAAVFVVNDSRDASADCVRDWAREVHFGVALVEAEFDPAIRSAAYCRRLALDCAASLVAPGGALLTSDADSRVAPSWIVRCLTELARDADLVCEDVRLDERELARLPDRVRRTGEVERAFFEASERLWQLWTEGRAGAFAYRASGASMALSARAYRAVGGLPLPTIGEDAALCAEILRRGLRVVQLGDAGTRTSARIEGRASGGCGGELARRARSANPACDARLLPVEELRRSAERRMRTGLATKGRTPPLRLSEVLRELGKARRLIEEHDRRDA
ncbi:glycosyltransferase family 2 protein [Erythrobacter sp.]|uniref:glycosyltransferase n=1 Tax=Erythrobacter sp. TaxID=1042 RepID=UPI001425FFAE|nr:glycosyltransferase family 2 protein [Erythrobacter sp.]QIQ85368.1 MAG: glycosyltransferase family 2 protein [Erythrobacter sp.]